MRMKRKDWSRCKQMCKRFMISVLKYRPLGFGFDLQVNEKIYKTLLYIVNSKHTDGSPGLKSPIDQKY